MKNFLRHLWREWILPLALIFLIGAPLRSAVVDWNWVPTGSMKPTILEGDLVLVNKLAYDLKVPFTTHSMSRWGDPARGDIVVLFSPEGGTRLVKRVVGLPGDTVQLRDEILYINGVAERYTVQDAQPFRREVREDSDPVVAIEHLDGRPHYVMALPHRAALRSFGPVTIPVGHYFVMGDSRDNSRDSRFFGTVPRDQIVGRASGVIVSFDLSRYLLPRVNRIAHSFQLDDAARHERRD